MRYLALFSGHLFSGRSTGQIIGLKLASALTALIALSPMALAQNLVTNGSFESGTVGFSSAYTYVSTPAPMALYAPGAYSVGTNPNNYHNLWASFGDHTTGSGNMIIFNGASTPNVNVWTSSVIAVTPNTNYYFGAWLTSVYADSPASLQFAANGQLLGTTFNASSGLPDWKLFFTVWNSGANTTTQLSIVNQNTAAGGNDFALDDISLSIAPPPGSGIVAPEPSALALFGFVLPVIGLVRRKA